MSEWQTIDSAPKDATPVLLYVPTRWHKRAYAIQSTGFWCAGSWLLPNADEAVQRVTPTHWKPLDTAPQAPTEPAGGVIEQADRMDEKP